MEIVTTRILNTVTSRGLLLTGQGVTKWCRSQAEAADIRVDIWKVPNSILEFDNWSGKYGDYLPMAGKAYQGIG
jgi:hypothetical protein